MADDFDQTIERVEERLALSTRRVATGKVTVRAITEVVDAPVSAVLVSSSVEVRRVPIGKRIDTVPPSRTEGLTTILSIVEERAVIETHLYLTEEVHLIRHETTETVETPVTLRRQTIVVERTDLATGQTTAETLPNHEE